MKKSEEKKYEDCLSAISDLIESWEQIRPDEELVVMVLPKYDTNTRARYLNQITEMLLKEKWDV